MSPSPRRDRLEGYMGLAVAAGTPWFAWSFLLATYPNLPPVAELDSDLWAYLLNRVLGISLVLEGIFFDACHCFEALPHGLQYGAL